MITTQIKRNNDPEIMYEGNNFPNELSLFWALQCDVHKGLITGIWIEFTHRVL